MIILIRSKLFYSLEINKNKEKRSMSFVKEFEKQEKNGLYSAKICDKKEKKDCQNIYDNYKLENAYPFDQTFPFESTPTNETVMIPDRIMRDKEGIKEFIFKNADKQSCFQVDPKDRFSSTIFCEDPRNENKEEKEINIKETKNSNLKPYKDVKINYQMLYIIMGIIFLLLSLIFVFCTTKYVLDTQQKTE